MGWANLGIRGFFPTEERFFASVVIWDKEECAGKACFDQVLVIGV